MASNKLIAKNASFLYLRMAVVMLVSIYVSRIVLAQLGESDYGIYNVVGGVVAMIMSLNSALSFGTQRFISFYLGKGNLGLLNKVFSTSFWIHFFIGIIVFVLLETLGMWFVQNILTIPNERIYAATLVLHMSILATFFAIIQVPFTALIIAFERMNVYAYVAIADSALKLFIAFQLSNVDGDKLIFYGLLMACIQFAQMIIFSSYCLTKFKVSHVFLCKDKQMYKDIMKYSGWNFLGTISFMLSDQGLNILLNIFFGPVVNASRAVAVQINNAVRQFVMNLQTAFNPQLVKLYSQGKTDCMLDLLYNNIKYTLALLWIIFLPVFCEIDYLLSIWLIKVPLYAPVFARIILLRLFLVCFEQPFITVNGATGYNKIFTIFSSLFLFSVLPLSYLALLITNEPQIVFIIDFVIYSFMILWKIFYLRRQVGLKPDELFSHTIKPICIIVILSVIPEIIELSIMSSSFYRLLLTIMISFIMNSLLIWQFALESNDKLKVYSYISSLKDKYFL